MRTQRAAHQAPGGDAREREREAEVEVVERRERMGGEGTAESERVRDGSWDAEDRSCPALPVSSGASPITFPGVYCDSATVTYHTAP